MSNSFYFDYDIFYNYYTESSNLETDKQFSKINIWYYASTQSREPTKTKLSQKYITINNTKIHIRKLGDSLLFTIPTEIGDKLWDFHFRFGKTIIVKNNENHPAVYFHKTIQKPIEKSKENTNCYYPQKINIDINSFQDMKCLQRDYYMRELYTPEDFVFIKEIISRPFLNLKVSTAGKSRKTRHHRKRRIRKTYRFIQKK